VDSESISVPLAFVAGLASFLSPCLLPLVPAYLGYVGSQAAGADGQGTRWRTFLHGLSFVIGFSAIFVALGAAASGIGRLAYGLQPVLMVLGGIIVILFGLNGLGVIRIPILSADTRHRFRARAEWGYLSSALVGFFFGAGYSPCLGATLGAILALALSETTIAQGAFLLFVYSMGVGLPLLVLALILDRVSPLIRRAQRITRAVSFVSGLLLVVMGAIVLIEGLSALGV